MSTKGGWGWGKHTVHAPATLILAFNSGPTRVTGYLSPSTLKANHVKAHLPFTASKRDNILHEKVTQGNCF
jgi:hypothetical protein